MAAAALIPLAIQSAPTIIDLITRLVHQFAPAAEAKLGPKTGPAKFGDVFASVITSLQQAAAAGTIDKALPADDTIKLIIQSVVSSMNISGQLQPPPAPAAIPATDIAGTNGTVPCVFQGTITFATPKQ